MRFVLFPHIQIDRRYQTGQQFDGSAAYPDRRESAEDRAEKTFYQIPEQITPELDIGKGCPEICPF